MTKKKNYNLQNENLFVASLYKDPDLFINYSELIKSKYDFYDEVAKFYYDCFELMYTTFSQEFTENKINIFMSQDEARFSTYKQYGTYINIKKYMDLTDITDVNNYFKIVKKYSLIREFERRGFPVQKMLNHPSFDNFSAEDIIKAMRYNVDNIQTIIGGGKDSIILGKDATKKIIEWTQKPSFGITFPWDYWSKFFRGFRRGKFILDAMLSNEGKSRKMVALAVHISMIEKEPLLIMTNEMSEEDITACEIVTVINHPALKNNFSFTLDKTEEEIVLGKYRDKYRNFIERKINENGEEIETDDEYSARLYNESEEYRNTIEVAQWIEQNSIIYFKEMRNYSDADLEIEIKKHVLGKGVTYIMYDTLKGYRTDDWGSIKQTATRLEEIAKELNVGIYGNNQLTDDSVFIDIFDYGSNNTANAKQLMHVLDFYVMERKIPLADYDKYEILDDFGGKIPLDKMKVYYGQKFVKSRTGGKGTVLVQEVDLDRNIWVELGILTKKIKPKKHKKSKENEEE